MQRAGGANGPVPLLFVDFDETLTQGDTVGALVDAAINAQARDVADPEDHQERLHSLRALKDKLVSEYSEAAQVVTRRHIPAPTEDNGAAAAARSETTKANAPAGAGGAMRVSTGGGAARDASGMTRQGEGRQLNMETVSGFLEDMNDFEQQMNAKVMRSGILAGLQEADVEAAARTVQLRPRARTTLAAALQRGWPVHVLSVNWSAGLVKAALAGLPCRVAADVESAAAEAQAGVRAVAIHTNTLEMQMGISTGNFACNIQGPMDKGNLLEDILLSAAAASGDGSAPAIFVGDSVGDLAALLAASVPIALGGNAKLRAACDHFGCTLQPLPAARPLEQDHPPGLVYTADSWREVYQALFDAAPSDHDVHNEEAQDANAAAPLAIARAASPDTPSPGGAAYGGSARMHSHSTDAASPVAARAQAPSQCAAPVSEDPPTAASTQHHPPTGGQGAVPRVLVVAGSDSGGGAGMQADIKACMACGAFASTAITALTAQNSHGVHAVHTPPVDTLRVQMRAVLDDSDCPVIKTGMLPDAESVAAVAAEVRALRDSSAQADAQAHGQPQLVVDPVMVSTSGHSLAATDVCAAMREQLAPLATVLTPNIAEASALLGGRDIDSLEGARRAAQDLQALGAHAVLVKGGHLAPSHDAAAAALGDSDSRGMLVDVLCVDGSVTELPTAHVATRNTHGTGCTLASSIASHLARGAGVHRAVLLAQRYVSTAIADSQSLQVGSGPQGAMDHGARLAHAPPQLLRRPLDLTLYAVTDPECNQAAGHSMQEAVAAAAEGGATMIQIREKDAGGGAFLQTVQAALRAAEPWGVPIIVNDRVDVALAAGAHGVHVGQDDLPCASVRRLVGSAMIVGVSVKTPAEAVKAARDGADYVGAGAVFATATKESSRAIGVEGVRTVVDASPVPVVAIGSVKADNAGDVMASGCAGVAVVSGVFAAPDVAQACRELWSALQ